MSVDAGCFVIKLIIIIITRLFVKLEYDRGQHCFENVDYSSVNQIV